MSLTLYYPETLRNGCSYFKSHSLLSHFSLLYHNFAINANQWSQPTPLHYTTCQYVECLLLILLLMSLVELFVHRSATLSRKVFEIWRGKWGELHSCLHLVVVLYTEISFSCMFLEMNLWWAQMCRMYVLYNHWSIYEKNENLSSKGWCGAKLRLIIGGWVKVLTILHTWLSMFGEDFGHNWSKS